MFVRLIVDNVERRYVTHRCPRDVTSFLNTIYKAAVATTSPVVHSLFAKNQAIKGSLYGDKSGGLWGYLNSNKSPQEEPITHRIRNENGSETRNNRASTSS